MYLLKFIPITNQGKRKSPTILKKRDTSLQTAFAQLGNEGSNCYWEFWDQLFQPILSLKP